MFKKSLLTVSAVTALSVAMYAEAKLYRWVDKEGITHYGETIPPEYADREKDVIKKSGLVEKGPEKLDPDAIKAKEQLSEQKKAEKQALMEEKRRNNMLLNTYSNEKEIDQARDRSLVLINARIESSQLLLKSAQNSLDDLNKEAESRSKSGKNIPVSLTNDIKQTQARVTKYQDELIKNQAELQEVKDKFEKEKELYRKLKGTASAK